MSDENSQTAIQEKVAQLTERLSIVQNDRAALRAQIAGSLSLLGFLKDELDGKNVAASSGADAEGALLSNASLLEQNIARLQAEIVTSRQVHSQMAQQISELLAGLHASGKSQSVKEVLHRIDDLNSCYATLFDLHSHLRSQTKPTAQGVASALNHLKTLETETAQLQGQREELAGQVAEASAAGSSQISKALDLARAPLDAEHAKQIAEINARITQQAAKRDSLLKEVDTLRAEANLWAARLSALSTAKAESAAMAANLKEELDRVKAQHQEEIAALNAQLTASTFPLSSYLATVQPIRSAIGESKAKHDAEARAIAATNKNVAYLQHQIKT
ncbi:MAG: hypothetical protein Q8P67_07800, partial [archaeon]|nr:hypothetical protein [archaeon]